MSARSNREKPWFLAVFVLLALLVCMPIQDASSEPKELVFGKMQVDHGGEPHKLHLGRRLFLENRLSNPGANLLATCPACHMPEDAPQGKRAYADFGARSVIPANARGNKLKTLRNTPTLLDAFRLKRLNHDGQFGSLHELLDAKLTSEHMGWMRDERDQALDEIHALMLNDIGDDEIANGSYLDEFKLAYDLDLFSLTRDEAIHAVVTALVDYVSALGVERTAPYDALTYLNRFAEEVDFENGDTVESFAGRLGGRIANQEGRGLLKTPADYSEAAYRGFKTFFRTQGEQKVGNCVACHYPPYFTDGSFHNAGVSQEAYDSLHGQGAFAQMGISAVDDRRESGLETRARPSKGDPRKMDLGHWNFVDTRKSPLRTDDETEDTFLARMIATFKTPTLRNLSLTDPYMHNGAYATLEDVIAQKIRASRLARRAKLVNPEPAYLTMNITQADVPELAAFLRSLDEVKPEAFRALVVETRR